MKNFASSISGIHHVTACCAVAQPDIDFFVNIVGQRPVKQAVLMDGDDPIYHFFYGDTKAQFGTIYTTFPTEAMGLPAGRKGTGQVKRTAYSVPPASLEFWQDHFNRHEVVHGQIGQKFGHRCMEFTHPHGLEFELIEDERDTSEPWTHNGTSADHAVRGIHSVTLSLRETRDTEGFLRDLLGFRKTGEEGNALRYELHDGGPQKTIYLLAEPDLPPGSIPFGAGNVHHFALGVHNDQAQAEIKNHIEGLGFTDTSDVKDRVWFHSIYVRIPGGVLVEFATLDMGFTVDESLDSLGQKLILPKRMEPMREEFMATLEQIDFRAK